MNTFRSIVLLLISVLLLVSCGNDKNDDDMVDAEKNAITEKKTKFFDNGISDDVLVDENVRKAYDELGDEFEVYAYSIATRFKAVDDNQLLQIDHLYYIPSANQMQVTVRYSTAYAEPATESFLPFIFELKDKNGNILSDFYYDFGVDGKFCDIRLAYKGVCFDDTSEYMLAIKQERNGNIVTHGDFLLQNSATASRRIELDSYNAHRLLSE